MRVKSRKYLFRLSLLTLTHASGTLVDIDGIWVEELLPAAFEGAEYTFDGDGNLVKSEVNGVVTRVPTIRASTMKKRFRTGTTAETCAECFFSKKHYSAGSSIIAVRTVIDGTQDTLNWLVAKHPVKGRRPSGQHESGYGQRRCGCK